MAFTEELKLTVRKKAHFRCALCHDLGVEIHHIVPQADHGPDTEENAAPLCPSCHETYGANPVKRKFIKEARDCWYEICSQRYASDPSILADLFTRLDQTASKQDLESFAEVIKGLITPEEPEADRISVGLPDRYWVIVLAALEPVMKSVGKRLLELKAQGYDPENLEGLPQEEVTSLVGTIFARGVIIDTLIERGIIKPEAGRMGARHIKRSVEITMEEYQKSKSK